MRTLMLTICLLLPACPAEDAAQPSTPTDQPDASTPYLGEVTQLTVPVNAPAIPNTTSSTDTGATPAAPTPTNGADVGADIGQFEQPPGLPPVPHGVLPCMAVHRVGPPDSATDFCVFQITAGGSPAACAFTKTVAGGVALSCWSTFQ